tara:strand:- start:409 stop:573 length:165 start_codon:yes stop_codon:yes gene_type:complete
MVEFELTDPSKSFLFGIDLLDGYTEDIAEDEETGVKILSIGLIIFKVNFLWIPK